MTATKLLDLKAAMSRVDQDLDILKEVGSMFLGDCKKLLKDLGESLGNKQFKQMEIHAHTLKSNISIFGAEPAVALAQRLEDLGRSHSAVDAGAIFHTLEAMVRQLESEIRSDILSSP